MTFHVAAMRRPATAAEATPAGVDWTYAAVHDLVRRRDVLIHGNDDATDPFETFVADSAPSETMLTLTLVALAGEADPDAGSDPHSGLPLAPTTEREVLGRGWVVLPQDDNPRQAMVMVGTDPEHEGRGIGCALAEAVEAVAARHGRDAWITWTTHRDEAASDDPDALVPPTGVGRLPRTRGARFALARGFSLEQVERQSTQTLPIDADARARRWAEVDERRAAHPGEYEVLSWAGNAPEEFVDDLLALFTAMSTDAPTAGLEMGEESWTRERYDAGLERRRRAGREVFTTVARHVATGRLVAFTDIVRATARPEVGHQHSTLVLSAHRGHRLGQWIKLANLDLLAERAPELERVHTWNADENEWMLRINVAMGYTRTASEGAWQRRVTL